MSNLRSFVFATPLLFASIAPLHGEDYAVLIGLNYRKAPFRGLAEKPLPGIELDIEHMRHIASEMGIRNVQVLWNEQATYVGIRQTLAALAQRVKPTDRVLIYYSGHGTHVDDDSRDEADGQDEALIPFDTYPGRNLLIDDEFGGLLDRIGSNRVLVVVDACHSGTGARAVGELDAAGSVAKFFDFGAAAPQEQMSDRGLDLAGDFLPKGEKRGKFVAIMGAKDSETAKATRKGSLLTIAVRGYFDEVAKGGQCSMQLESMFATVQSRVVRSAEELRRTPPDNGPQTPQLQAEDPTLRKQTIALQGRQGCTAAPVNVNERMQYWNDFAAQAPEKLTFSTNASAVPVHPNPDTPNRCSATQGLLSMQVTAPRDGYLTILNIGEGDQAATVLFPNGFQRDNRVRSGHRIQIPGSGQNWCLPARLPAGRNSQDVLVVAIFTENNVNLFQKGEGTGTFREISGGARSFAAESGKMAPDNYAAGRNIVRLHK
jgi:hypothetical protein